jgi:hypothetical protein
MVWIGHPGALQPDVLRHPMTSAYSQVIPNTDPTLGRPYSFARHIPFGLVFDF